MTRDLETALHYRFQNLKLLETALTHSTYANEHPEEGESNERLEFLGDAVLGLLVGRLLFEHKASASEGELSQLRARMVRRESLAELATELDLARFLQVGEGQRKAGVADAARLLADAYEAIAGAVFLDGGFEAVARVYAGTFTRVLEKAEGARDYKTTLQELCHKHKLVPPRYAVVSESGPEHARRYVCEVWVNGRAYGPGEGPNKKVAEQACAKLALESLSP